jgi:hypothetical protein
MKAKMVTLKTAIALILIAIASVSVISAVLVSNYLIPSSVTVTTAPGILCLDVNDAAVMTLPWGDVQQGMTKEFVIQIKNVQGVADLYLLRDASLTHDMPANIGTLTWNWDEILPGEPYALLKPDWTFPACRLGETGKYSLKLKLTVKTDGSQGSHSFSITINAFDTSTG